LLRTSPADVGVAVKVTNTEANRAPIIFKGSTPLLLAMGLASWAVIEALLDHGANPHANDCVSQTPFHAAAILGRRENIRAWLRRFPSWDVEQTSIMATTALHISCFTGAAQHEVVRELLNAGANRSAVNAFGSNPLHLLAHNPDADVSVMRALLHDPPPGAPTVNSLRHAPGCLMPFVVGGMRLLARWTGSESKLIRFLAMIEGSTALHIAAMHGDLELCLALVATGADRSPRNRMGMTPLEAARWFGMDYLFAARDNSGRETTADAVDGRTSELEPPRRSLNTISRLNRNPTCRRSRFSALKTLVEASSADEIFSPKHRAPEREEPDGEPQRRTTI